MEEAFLGSIPLIDADRPFLELFERIGVVRLSSGDNVEEEFLAESAATPASVLRHEIATQLSPYLLAPVIARSDRAGQGEVILRRLLDRFEVKAADCLKISYSLRNSSIGPRCVERPKFYLQRRLLAGPGAIREAHFTLYVQGEASVSFADPLLDADALGEALSLLFMDGVSEEMRSLFPRIVSRFHHAKGEPEAMEEFLYYQLRISREAQDMARAMISGEAAQSPAMPPPPPAKIRVWTTPTTLPGREDHGAIEQKIRETFVRETDGFVTKIVNPQGPTTESIRHAGSRRITPQQEVMGRRGEEEIKRRLERAGGWEGFTLVEDVRSEGCGYDFLCARGEDRSKLEVKTFAPNGQVFVTSNELHEAACSRKGYYLVGVLDDDHSECEWATFIIQDPIDTLLIEGAFDIETTLRASAARVFNFERDK
jgi:hypothetical protein